jgi:hypothetical protein
MALGPFGGGLADGGEKITLKNKNGRVMDEVEYNDRFPWPVAADGSGATLAKIDELGASAESRNWRASLAYGGTPGEYNFVPPSGTGQLAPSQAGVQRYFRFDGDALDSSGTNTNGTLVGGVVFSSETPPLIGAGQSLDCDGVNDYVQVIDNVQPNAYTISVWIKADIVRAQSIIARGTSSTIVSRQSCLVTSNQNRPSPSSSPWGGSGSSHSECRFQRYCSAPANAQTAATQVVTPRTSPAPASPS